jgi:hypothetical protein
MLRLHAGRESSRYYLCQHCGTIREDVCRPDGTIAVTHFHQLVSANLPPVVAERAQDILTQPSYRQLPLFGE